MRITSDSILRDSGNTEVPTRSKLSDAAQQFEGMLLQEMLKPMRSSDGEWGGDENTDNTSNILSTFGTETMAKAISKAGGLGIARQVVAKVSAERQAVQKKN